MAVKQKQAVQSVPNADAVMDKAISKMLMMDAMNSSGLVGMKLIKSEEMPTMGTDGVSLWWNPAFVADLSWQECAAVLAHEVWHRFLGHNWRIKTLNDADARLYNVAADAVINMRLASHFHAVGLPFVLPAGRIMIEWVTLDMTTEEVYERLKQNSSGGDGAGGFDGGGDLNPAPDGASEAAALASAQQAVAAGQAAGQYKGALDKELKDIEDRMVDWRALLASSIQATLGWDDWSYRRARLSGMRNGVVLPTLTGTRVGTVVVCIDTSGSHWHLIETCFAEVKGLFETMNPETVHVMQGDTSLARHDVYHSASDIVMQAAGGGGSNFVEMLEAAREIDAEAVVFITDADGQWPSEPVSKLITVLVGSHCSTVPYGRVVNARADL